MKMGKEVKRAINAGKGQALQSIEYPKGPRQTVHPTDHPASYTYKVCAKKTKNAEIGTLHCAQSSKKEFANVAKIVLSCTRRIRRQQHHPNRPRSNPKAKPRSELKQEVMAGPPYPFW